MWIYWLALSMVSIGLVLVSIGVVMERAGSLARDRLHGVGTDGGRGLGKWLRGGGEPTPMSSGQARFVAALRVAGCIGLVIIWGALVYVFTHPGGSHLAQLWQDSPAAQALLWSLFYTSLVINLMGTQIFVGPSSLRRYGIACHAFAMFCAFVLAIAALIEHS